VSKLRRWRVEDRIREDSSRYFLGRREVAFYKQALALPGTQMRIDGRTPGRDIVIRNKHSRGGGEGILSDNFPSAKARRGNSRRPEKTSNVKDQYVDRRGMKVVQVRDVGRRRSRGAKP
jgi:hypothetical protein